MKSLSKVFQDKLILLERAMDYSRVGIAITDASLEDNPIVYVNEGFLTMTGYSEDEVLGLNCRFLQGIDTDRSIVATIREKLLKKERISVTIKNYKKNGTFFWNELTIDPFFMEEENRYYFIGVQKDITNQREYQLKLEATLQEIDRLSTPLVPLSDHIHVLPLIGHLSEERFEKISTTVLSSMNMNNAEYLILDLSGLSTFNGNTATLIDQLYHLLKLLGTELIVTGISPTMAMKAGNNGELQQLTTFLTVQEAVKALTKFEG
ncbi:blue light GTP-binding receptor [Fictibacillus macauensis ZFHKF-1]|uniref:Blue light GTP-binding receptor n=1 Tax=Fictibacillus macauensis ZFHKF-1 TaxID=1196324 RepID=I8AIW7_9BACL|nr:STAS domain-containing protein [Fictibacillus macauensis]EIT85707.1 blue light GTP-binding receptor [Fictibacillus macauensis ZFHKF-1]